MRPYLRYAIAGTLAILMGAAQLAIAQPTAAGTAVADSASTLIAWGGKDSRQVDRGIGVNEFAGLTGGPPRAHPKNHQAARHSRTQDGWKMPGQARHFSFVTAAKIERAASDRVFIASSASDDDLSIVCVFFAD